MAGMVDHKGKAEISFRNQRKKTWKGSLKGKEKASYSEMLYMGLFSWHLFILGTMRYSTESCSGAPGRFLIFSLHLRSDCFLKTDTSGCSGQLLAFYQIFLCFTLATLLLPDMEMSCDIHWLLHEPTTELLQIPACVYVGAHPPSFHAPLCSYFYVRELILLDTAEAVRGSVLGSPSLAWDFSSQPPNISYTNWLHS